MSGTAPRPTSTTESPFCSQDSHKVCLRPGCGSFPNRTVGIHWPEPHTPPPRMHDDKFAP